MSPIGSFQPMVISLWAEQVEQAVHFYTGVLGLQLAPGHHHPPHLVIGGSYLVIMKGKPRPPENPERSPWPILALQVEDLAGLEARLSKHGIPILARSDPGSLPSWIMFADPAGNIIELLEMPAHS